MLKDIHKSIFRSVFNPEILKLYQTATLKTSFSYYAPFGIDLRPY